MLMWSYSCKELSDVEVREMLEAIIIIYFEESAEGLGSGDGDEALVGDTKKDCKVGRVVGVCESGEKGMTVCRHVSVCAPISNVHNVHEYSSQ